MSAQRGRLGAYALWQAGDYLLGPAIWTVFVAGVLGVFPMIMFQAQMSHANVPAGQLDTMMAQRLDAFIGILAFFGPMLAVNGLVSKDRAPGLSRFLFAKPVGVAQYYAQAWVIRGGLLLAVTALSVAAVNSFLMKVALLPALGTVGVSWLLIGGAGLLVSVLTAQDTGVLIVVYLLPDLLDGMPQVAPSMNWLWKPLLEVMPPMHRLDEIRRSLFGSGPIPGGDIWHAALYGVACVALAAYLVRRLPLVR